MIPFILKTNSVTLFPAGQAPLVVDASHMNFNAVVQAIKDSDFDLAVELGSVSSFVAKVSAGNVVVNDDGVFYKGTPLNNYLTSKIVQFFNEGLDVSHYCAFLDNVMANPSMTSRNELYMFLESADLPITEDGCFMAYKAVTSDLKDKYTQTVDNSPGQKPSMDRGEVDDNRNRTCSKGYHAASYEYARNFLGSLGDKMVAVKINPADVVSVPSDYNNQKLRTCKYEVMFVIEDKGDIFKGQALYVDNQPSDDDEGVDWWPNYNDEEDDNF